MTENTSVPNAPRDGKAQAAADKAYRKATRPWFKKKRFLIPMIFVALMIITSIGNAGKEEPSAAVDPAGDASAAAPAAPAAEASAAAEAPAAEAPAQAATEVMAVEAAALLADFEGNEAAADAKYKGKVLQVTGNVSKVDTEFLNKDQYVVKLNDGSPYSFTDVNCNDQTPEQAIAVVIGSTVTVQGAFQDGGDLGVELKDCKVL